MNKTYEIFDNNFADYIMRTINVDFSEDYKRFLPYVKDGGHIFDVGCGSGRDSWHFKKMGYKITAIDGGREFCHFAGNLLGQEVKQTLFQDIDFKNEFDGVWAMASLHHLDKNELLEVLKKIYTSLKPNGAFLFNARHGTREYDNIHGKHFCEFNSETFKDFIAGDVLCEFEIKEDYVREDYRDGRSEEWYTAILVKTQ